MIGAQAPAKTVTLPLKSERTHTFTTTKGTWLSRGSDTTKLFTGNNNLCMSPEWTPGCQGTQQRTPLNDCRDCFRGYMKLG